MLRPIVTAAMLTVLGAGAARAQTVRQWFRMAPCSGGSASLLQPDPAEGWRVLVDEPHGYLRAGNLVEGNVGTEYTFAIFRKADGTRIFACQMIEASDDGTGFHLGLYELRGGRMVEITRPLVPRLDLADFLAPGTPPPPREFRVVNLRYVLPRVGTTIRVEPEALDGDEPLYANFSSDAEIDRYRRLVGARRYRAIELNWDRVRGVFTVGRKIPR